MSDFFREKSSTSSEDDLSQEPFLSDEPQDIPSRKTKASVSFGAKQLFLLVGTAIISVAATAVFFTSIGSSSNLGRETASVNPEYILDCGTSGDEAQARGCVFDIMHYSWIPAPCYNDTLSQQYWDGLKSHGIEFWNDTTKMHVLPYEEILAAKHEYVYTSWLLHLKHCQYLLHRQFQTLTYGGPVDNASRNVSHSEHCLEEVRSPSDVKTMLYTGMAYLRCAQGVGDIGAIYWNDPPAN